MATTVLGPLVPALSRVSGLSDAMVATVFTTQYVCSTAVTLLSSSLVVRFDAGRVIIAGFLLAAAGIAALGFVPWPFTLLATMIYGCGLGLVLPTTNFVVARMNPGREASAVSLVNVSWAGGAVAWPVIVSALSRGTDIRLPLALLACLLAGVAARLAVVRRWAKPGESEARGVVARATGAQTIRAAEPVTVTTGLLVAFGLLLTLYSGSEASIGGWVAEHVRRLGAVRWAMATTSFWAAITLGRLATPWLLARALERTVLVGALGVAIGGGLTLALARTPPVAFAAMICAGLGLSPVFPITFGALTRDVAPRRPRLVGPLYACTGVGSAALPWLVGACSTLAGSLAIGLLVPVLGCAGLLALSLYRLSRP